MKKRNHRLTAVSLFSGCGGFDWGAKKAGVKIIWANDIDPHAASAYKKIFPKVPFLCDDIRNIKEFPKADIVIGCYPCTGFSLASRRRGKNLKRKNLKENPSNFLFKEFLRAVKQIRPKYLFVENVEGMLNAGKGWFFKQQLNGFRKLNYELKYKVIYANDFGVPQQRKRLFIVGIRKEKKRLEYEFPLPTHGPKGSLPYITLRKSIGKMKAWPTGEFLKGNYHGHYLTRNRKRPWDEPSFTVVASACHVPLHPMGKPLKKTGVDRWKLQGVKNRRLSWRECARIQGLPAKARPTGKLTDKYRVVGNAVPPNLAKSLLLPVVTFETSR